MGNSEYIIKYYFTLDKEGPWEIWVYLFEDKPKRRSRASINNEDNHPVEIRKVRFVAGHTEQSAETPWVVLAIVAQILALGGICFSGLYKILKKYWDKISENWHNNKYTYIIVILFILITTYLSYSLCNC